MGAANKRKMSRVLFILLLTKEDESARSAHWKDDFGCRRKGQRADIWSGMGPRRLFSVDAKMMVRMRQR